MGLRALPDTAPADVLAQLGNGVLKPRVSSALRDVRSIGTRWAVARVWVYEYALFRSEYRRDGLRCGDAVLLADGGILHPPALVLDLDPGSWTWSEDDDLLVEATVLLDRSHEPVELWTLPRVLLEAATWSTGAVRAEMRGCLLDLWGLDLTCPRCAGRGGAIQFGMRAARRRRRIPMRSRSSVGV